MNAPKDTWVNRIGSTIYTEAFGPVKVLEVTWSEAAKDNLVVVDQYGTLFAAFGEELSSTQYECKEPSS